MPAGEAGLFVDYCAKDFLDGTHQLDPWVELAYRRICDMIYTTNDRLANDDRMLAWATKTGRRWRAIKQALTGGDRPKLLIVDGRLTNRRCQDELHKAAERIAQKREAGAASAAAGKSRTNLRQYRRCSNEGIADTFSTPKRVGYGGVTPTPSVVPNSLANIEPPPNSVRSPVPNGAPNGTPNDPGNQVTKEDSKNLKGEELGRCAPSGEVAAEDSDPEPAIAVDALVASAVAHLEGKRTRVIDPVAYERSVEERKWLNWLATLHPLIGEHLSGAALWPAYEAISAAQAAGSREATPREVRDVLNRIAELRPPEMRAAA